MKQYVWTHRGLLGVFGGAASVVWLVACERLSADEKLIAQEAKKLPVTQQQREREIHLWNSDLRRTLPLTPITEANFPQAVGQTETLTKTTLNLMRQSQNQYFKESYAFLQTLIVNDEITFRVSARIFGQQGRELSLKLVPETKDGKMHWFINISANQVINRLPAGLQASEITHELRHIQNMKAYFAILPLSLSPEEKLRLWNERMSNPDELAKEEADAYAVEAFGHIHAYALGDRSGRGLSYERYTAEFVRSGMEARSDRWIAFIRKEQRIG